MHQREYLQVERRGCEWQSESTHVTWLSLATPSSGVCWRRTSGSAGSTRRWRRDLHIWVAPVGLAGVDREERVALVAAEGVIHVDRDAASYIWFIFILSYFGYFASVISDCNFGLYLVNVGYLDMLFLIFFNI